MASTFTSNKSLDKQGAGDNVGTWGTPLNSDLDIVDQALGTTQVISLAAGSITLSTAQARSPFLIFTGALPSNVTVTIPGLSSSPGTIVSGGFYTILDQTSNSSTRTVTLATTVAGQEVIGCLHGEPFDVFVLGTNSSQAGSVKFRSLGKIGSYWDYAGSSVPAWVSACTKPPYLYCDGSAFSSASYPILATIMATTTLPDTRGRTRFSYNDGTSRLTNAVSINGNNLYAGGGDQNPQSHSHGVSITSATESVFHNHIYGGASFAAAAGGGANVVQVGTGSQTTDNNTVPHTHLVSGNTTTTSSGTYGNVPPGYIGGITLIRAA